MKIDASLFSVENDSLHCKVFSKQGLNNGCFIIQWNFFFCAYCTDVQAYKAFQDLSSVARLSREHPIYLHADVQDVTLLIL